MTDKMLSIRATTDAGKQAKARVVLSPRIAGAGFHKGAAAGELWEASITELIAELCGMSPLALAACHY
jgi:hypothetical protein